MREASGCGPKCAAASNATLTYGMIVQAWIGCTRISAALTLVTACLSLMYSAKENHRVMIDEYDSRDRMNSLEEPGTRAVSIKPADEKKASTYMTTQTAVMRYALSRAEFSQKT